jgi:hypothetical protein
MKTYSIKIVILFVFMFISVYIYGQQQISDITSAKNITTIIEETKAEQKPIKISMIGINPVVEFSYLNPESKPLKENQNVIVTNNISNSQEEKKPQPKK